MKPKRFLVFVYGDYYPSGGIEDLVFAGDDIQEAKKKAFEHDGAAGDTHRHILDVQYMSIHEFINGDWKERFLV